MHPVTTSYTLEPRELVSPNPKEKSSRADTSLSVLTRRFLEFLLQQPNRQVDLNFAVEKLGYAKRRLYDVTNVLEGVGVIEKTIKNTVRWCFPDKNSSSSSTPIKNEVLGLSPVSKKRKTIESLTNEIKELESEEAKLDELIYQQSLELKYLTEDRSKQEYSYVTSEDLLNGQGLKDKIMLCIKAPEGTKIEVLPADERLDLTLLND